MEEEALLPESEEAKTEAEPLPEQSLSAEEEPKEDMPEANEPSVDYEALAASDLKEIQAIFSEFNFAKHLNELPFAHRFAELRDMGLSVKEALFATLPSIPRASGKEHLQSAVPRAKSAPAGGLSTEEMRAAKDLFYGLSEKEIDSLYRRVSAK